jgi:RNA polymerase sigma-70 factor, ECF subfamily
MSDQPGPAADAGFAQAVARAGARHPALAVSDDAFAQYVRARLEPDVELEDADAHLELEDLFLACACAAGDERALTEFERVLMPMVRAAITAAGPSDDIDEVAQRVRERLLVDAPSRPAAIRSYAGTGPIAGWLRVCAVRHALMLRRGSTRTVPLDTDERVEAAVTTDPELTLIKSSALEAFRTAFRAALDDLPARDKNVLRYQIIDGLGSDEIARIYRVHRVTVTRWQAKARHTLLRQTRRRLALALNLDRAGFDSLMGLIESRLDVSLDSAFRGGNDSRGA